MKRAAVVIRRISQALFLTLFLYLFLKTTYPLKTALPPDLFLRLSFLNALVNFLTTGQYLPAFIPAAIVAVLTLLAGRLFCGWLCPMGAIIDVSDGVLFRTNKARSSGSLRSIRFVLLVLILLTGLAGTSLLFALDPLVIITRSFSLALFPPFYLGWQALAAHFPWMESVLVAPTAFVYYKESAIFLLLFIGILALGALQRRFWCRNLCPLGALLSLIARAGCLVRRVGAGCTDCMRCVKTCRMNAIAEDPSVTSPGECVGCFTCVRECPAGAVTFGLRAPVPRAMSKSAPPAPGLSRREVLLTIGGSAVWSLWGRTDFSHGMRNPYLIRPPGALAEREFLRTCVRCGGCMKVCITNGLQPSLFEGGLEGIWTPRLIPRVGACEQMCDMCSRVCPTGAIRKFAVEEKERIFIGQAFIDRSKCIAWNRGEECLVCDEVCSYKAVYWRPVQDIFQKPPNKEDCEFCALQGKLCPFHGEGRHDILRRPFVNARKCVGCGLCENRCPVNPDPAILVTSVGEKRGSLDLER